MLLQDLAFAGRTLRKSPIFALTAALTIALGVGASTAIFSVTNAVLLRPLPYKDPDRLVIACSDLRNRNVRDFPFSNANFIDLREGTKNAFQDLAGVFTDRNVLQREDGTPEQIRLAVVTTNFFRLVGAKMAFGRDFTDADGIPQPPPLPAGAQPAAPPPRVPTLAILSYEYFQRRYGGNPTASYPFPLAGGFHPIRWGTGEALADASKFQAADDQIVLPGYFEVMRTSLLAGRTFTDADNAPGRNVVLIDQLLADKAFPHQSAVGKRILIRTRTPEPEWVEVIGVVAHQREESLAERGREQVYLADAFLGSGGVQNWAVRVSSDPASYGSEIRAAIKALDAHLLITEMQPVETLVGQAQAGTRFSLLLIGVFAVIAGLLAGVGLYGVLSTVVRQRTAEIGIRMALGAGPARIFSLVVGQGLRLTTTGIAAGLIAAFALTRGLTTMLVGVKATDPATFATMAVVFFLIAATASWLPARRAAGLDPTAALREE